MQVYAFIDTNVLLHYKFFRDVDWAAALGAPEVQLVLGPVVLSELDNHKWSGSRREKSRAKAVLKALDDLGLSAAPVSVRPGVSVAAVAAEPDDAMSDVTGFSPRCRMTVSSPRSWNSAENAMPGIGCCCCPPTPASA